jgi:hypothetical protein
MALNGVRPLRVGRKTDETACFLTNRGYRNDIVSSRKNVTGMGAGCKGQIDRLRRRDGLEKHLLDVVDLPAQGNKI